MCKIIKVEQKKPKGSNENKYKLIKIKNIETNAKNL